MGVSSLVEEAAAAVELRVSSDSISEQYKIEDCFASYLATPRNDVTGCLLFCVLHCIIESSKSAVKSNSTDLRMIYTLMIIDPFVNSWMPQVCFA